MKAVINITTSDQDMDRFADNQHIKSFYETRALDGLEIMFTEGNTELPEKLKDCKVIGIHLSFMATWMDFWTGNEAELIKQHGSLEACEKIFGGKTPDDYLVKIEKELEKAEEIGAEYVVFHVSEITPEETFTFQCKYSDEEVIHASIELINKLLDGKAYKFYFLCENLWWAGLNLKDPKMTQILMNGIHYEKKGIMLDTGHLLHTNPNLRTQDEAVDFIHHVLDQDETLSNYVKGVHLHQTLSGEYVQGILENPPKSEKQGNDRFFEIMMHVFQIDKHQPFVSKKLPQLIERISPLYLNHELITSGLEEHSNNLDAQLKAVRD